MIHRFVYLAFRVHPSGYYVRYGIYCEKKIMLKQEKQRQTVNKSLTGAFLFYFRLLAKNSTNEDPIEM